MPLNHQLSYSAQSPGKLILSGEHSVLYGATAIAVAIADNVSTYLYDDSNHRKDELVRIFLHNRLPNLPDFSSNKLLTRNLHSQDASSAPLKLPDTEHFERSKYTLTQNAIMVECTLTKLYQLKDSIDNRYNQFLQGTLPISKVLGHPANLLFYTLAHAKLERGGDIHLQSRLPVGAGLGSSAACIAALLKLVRGRQQKTEQSADKFAAEVQYCERLQHGRGSLIDASTVSFGGAIKAVNQEISQLDELDLSDFYVWHSGIPSCTTGEVVCEVRKKFAHSQIWQQFDATTKEFLTAVQNKQSQQILNSVKNNHHLLDTIGVVPKTVNKIIGKLNKLGAAAKICGAGSLGGLGGGQVLIYAPKMPQRMFEKTLDITTRPLKVAATGAALTQDLPPNFLLQ